MPAFFTDWHLSYRLPFDHIRLSIEVNQIYSSSYYQGYVFRQTENDLTTVTKVAFTNPSYYIMDLGLRYITSSVRLELFAYVRNVFAKRYGGLSATGSPDDIYFNPQQGRRFQLGVSYRLGIGN